MLAWLRPRQWRLFAIAPTTFLHPPTASSIPLPVAADAPLLLHGDGSMLLLWIIPGSSHPEKLWTLDPLTGQHLWTLPRSCGRPFFLHLEPLCPWLLTAEKGIFLLSKREPTKVFSGSIAATSRARLSPDGQIGFLNTADHSLLAFAPGKKTLWNRPPSPHAWQAPFPTFDSQGVCVSNGASIQRFDLDGDPLWSWPPPHLHNDQQRLSIERLIAPDTLLVRLFDPSRPPRHATIDAKTGSLLHELGSVWAFGADGRSAPPTAFLDGDSDQIAFLLPNGSKTRPSPLRTPWLRRFLIPPPDTSLLLYDRWLRFFAGLGPSGRLLWEERIPDPSGFFAHHFAPPHLFLCSPEQRLYTLTFPS